LRAEISDPNGSRLQVDVLHNLLLQSAVLDRLSDVQIDALRLAIALLAAPAIEGVVDVVAEAVTKGGF
jgi:hypothetical protein